MLNPMTFLTALILFAISPALPLRPVLQDVAPAQAPPAVKNPVKPTAESQAKAKKIYGVDCAMCHGDNGSGKSDLATAMQVKLLNWTDPAALANLSDGDLFKIIRNGKDKMPPEVAGRADDTEVWNLIIYIRKMSQPAAATPSK
jgi:mono/diheme cytochrome c family protein